MSLIEQAKKAVEDSKRKPIVWEISFFDEDEAQRLDWFEATTDKIAVQETKKKWKSATIRSVKESKYTMEELEGFD
jgi:hypothetical protein